MDPQHYGNNCRANNQFRRTVQKVMLLQTVTRQIIRITEKAQNVQFWGDISFYAGRKPVLAKPKETETTDQRAVSLDGAFDKTHFKCPSEFTFPDKAIRITMQRPEERSPEEVLFLRHVMKDMLSFRQYSNSMQLMLVQVVRYERFGRSRVVVRKGHRGDSFYFVFSGAVSVTRDEDGSSAFLDHEPILLKKGVSFGDIALLKGLRRNATVVCVEETELLVVDKEDFLKNKLDLELQKELEYRFQFFRSLDVFSSLSDDSLMVLASHCKAEQFHHSKVVVSDTSKSKNIIFIVKGRCNVLRLLDLTRCPSYLKRIKKQEVLPGVLARNATQAAVAGIFRGVTLKDSFSVTPLKMPATAVGKTSGKKIPRPRSHNLDNLQEPIINNVHNDGTNVNGSELLSTRKSVPASGRRSGVPALNAFPSDINEPQIIHTSTCGIPNTVMKTSQIKLRVSAPEESSEGRDTGKNRFSRCATEQLSIRQLRQTTKLSRRLLPSAYLCIDSLWPGEYFNSKATFAGLREKEKGVDMDYIENHLQKEDNAHQQQECFWSSNLPSQRAQEDRPMVICSLGSEIIRIKLNMFCELADISTLIRMKKKIQPYPSDGELCRIFLEDDCWKLFKENLVCNIRQTKGAPPL